MTSGNKFLCLVLGLCVVCPSAVLSAKPGLTVVEQWSQLEFDYDSDEDRQSDIDAGTFVPGITGPIDVDVFYSAESNSSRVFITTPRWMIGSPITFGTVTAKELNGNPIITPYPSWDWHKNPTNCSTDRIVSVFRTAIDECDRLWIVDTGVFGGEQVCDAQLLAFDLNTDTLVHRYEIPSDLLYPNLTLLVNSAVDVRDANGTCEDTFVYMADCQGFAVFVYDVQNNASWKVQDKTMYPNPYYGTYYIAEDVFDVMDGVLGLALSPYVEGEERSLFYHAMSSSTENWVETSIIRNQTRFSSDPDSSPQVFRTYPDGRDTQSAAQAINKDGILFFGLMTDIEIVCWDTHTDYGRSNFGVISDNGVTDQFISGIKVIKNNDGEEELWAISSKYQKIAAGTLNATETNFRILTGKVDDLIDGTKCKVNLS